jgi:molybdate transport system substrate-binding protein
MTSAHYRPWMFFGISAAAFAVLAGLLMGHPSGHRSSSAPPTPLMVLCAAGIRSPVETVAREYERNFGVPVQLQYGGSQTLLASLELSRRGDLYLPADESYLKLAREKHLVNETIPLALVTAVLAVKKGNPKRISSCDDLLRGGATIAQANPDAAAIGKLTRAVLRESGQWAALERRTTVFKPTVNEVANDLKLGTVDAGFIWDAMLKQYPELEGVPAPELGKVTAHIAVSVLKTSAQPTAALRFARYLAASGKGLTEFARQGYQPVEGDEWAETPELVLYSGAMNRVAVEESIQCFERREGAKVTRIYNGCGILVAQMKAGGRPDAYLTCDKSFVPPVGDLFPEPPVEMSDSAIVLLVAKGNPKHLRSLANLVQPKLRVGLANPEQSTLGALTRRLLEQSGILEAVMANVATQTPTADLLVNQMRTGALDAAVVYASNTTQVREQLDIIRLDIPNTIAVQTFSVGKNSRNKQLARRLREWLQSAESRARYEAAGFHWRNADQTEP